MHYDIAFIGAGNMAEAIARGMLSAGRDAGRMIAVVRSDAKREIFGQQLGMMTTSAIASAAGNAAVVLLAVKPYQMADVLPEIKPVLQPGSLVVSVAAGISCDRIERALATDDGVERAAPWEAERTAPREAERTASREAEPEPRPARGGDPPHDQAQPVAYPRVVRAMPNTPMQVGQGAVALARGRTATNADIAAARSLFGPAAPVVIEVPESQIDAVVALSGSGPAYVFYLIEQMIAAGQTLGLSAADARALGLQTALGAATMAATRPESPADLRRKVTSPNGTTHAAITTMQQAGVAAAINAAMTAARDRSAELGKQ